METKIEKELKKKLILLDRIENINYGGCAIAALAISKWLDKKGVENAIIYQTFGNSSLESNLMNANKNKGIGANSCPHAQVLIEGLFWDSAGFHFPKEDFVIVSKESVIYSINNSTWNPSFNRTSISEIEGIFEVSLKEVCESNRY